MRAPLSALSSVVFGLALVAGVATQANAAPAAHPDTPAPTASHDMADMSAMNHTSSAHQAAPAASAHGKPDQAAAMRRAKLKPVFLAARLNGRNEVQEPGKPAVGDRDGSATGLVRVQGDRVTFAFSWQGIGAPTLGHIHEGRAGVNGAVKVPLFTTAMPATASAAAGVVTVDDPATADALRANPANFYLNLHSQEFPGGAVRGQLSKLARPADLLGLLDDGGVEKAFLSGDQEVPTADGPAVGDPNGRAVAFVKARNTQVGYAIAWTGITPTLGHIHKAPPGMNGPVVVPLFATAVPATIVAISGTATGLDPALVKDIAKNPSAYYANLHTAEFPGGAVRGQLFNRR